MPTTLVAVCDSDRSLNELAQNTTPDTAAAGEQDSARERGVVGYNKTRMLLSWFVLNGDGDT